MLGDGLNAIDRLDIDLLENVLIIGGPDRRCVLTQDYPELAHCLGSEHLDLPPNPITVLGRPNGRHLGTGITRDHGRGG